VFEVWLTAVPQQIAAKARAEFPGVAACYRIRDDPGGHYCLGGFVETASFTEFATSEYESIMAKLMHGKDSISPGAMVTVPFTKLIICGCGNWEPPEGPKIENDQIDMPIFTWTLN
jgi:hypothetical protein